MVRLTIYKKGTDITGAITNDMIRCEVNEWTFQDTIMDSQYLTFNAQSENPIEWQIGDFCYYRGVPYTLNQKPSVTQNAHRGKYGKGFEYSDVKFESALADLDRCIILDITPSTGDYQWPLGQNHTGNAVFQLQCCETNVILKEGSTRTTTLFTPVEYLMGVIKANLDRVFPDAGWKVEVETSKTHTDDTLISFNNTSATDALKMVKETFSLYYCVIGRTIYVGYDFENLTSKDFDAQNPTWDETSLQALYSFGYGKGEPTAESDGTGLYKIEKKTSGDGNIITRLRAYGSTRNLPYRYYNEKYKSVQTGGFFVTNLQLPNAFDDVATKNSENARRDIDYPGVYAHVLGTPTDCYIDKDNDAANCEEGIWEGVGVWDGSDKDHEEIYPTIEDMDYQELRAALIPDYSGDTGSEAFEGYLDEEKVNVIEAVDERTNFGDGITIPFEKGIDQTGITVALSGKATTHLSTFAILPVTMEIGRIDSAQVAADYTFSREAGVCVKVYADGETNEYVKKYKWYVKFFAEDKDGNEIGSWTLEPDDLTWVGDDDTASDGYFYAELPLLPYVEDGTTRKMTLAQDSTVSFKVTLSSTSLNYHNSPTYIVEVYNRVGGNVQGVWRNANVASTYADTPFTIYVRDFGLNFAKLIDTGETPVLSMKTGACVACDFTLSGADVPMYLTDEEERLVWKLTFERCYDSSIGAYYPSSQYPINAGDKFVILNCELPDGYVEAAEIRLLKAATEYLKKVQEQSYTYSPSFNNIYLQNDYDKNGEKSVYWNLYAGVKFPIYDIPNNATDELVKDSILIKSVSIKEGGLVPEVDINLDDTIEETIQQRLNNTISRLSSSNTSEVSSALSALIKKLEAGDINVAGTDVSSDYLSKKKKDTAQGVITFKKGATMQGDLLTHDVIPSEDEEYSLGSADYRFNEAHVKSVNTDKVNTDEVTVGTYNQGVQGGHIDSDGNGELNSLTLRESLTVPTITYNSEEWIGGNTWRSAGGGIIKAVADIDGKHIALLDIKADEGGKIAVGDKCQGIFHLTGDDASGNATEDTDERNGHFTFKGFKTIYFLITSVNSDDWIDENSAAIKAAFSLTKDELSALKGMNAFFTYSLRSEVDSTWTDATHPQPQLNFAEYANANEASRQQILLVTPEYDLGLVGMTGWTYGQTNIQYIARNLNGFTIIDSNEVAHELSGYGLAFGRAYMWGTIEQFDRDASLVSQQLFRKAFASDTKPAVTAIGVATEDSATTDKPYLWGYWRYIYSDGTTKNSDVFLVSNFGRDTVVYSLVPEKTGVNISADGTYDIDKLSVLVQKREGLNVYPSVDYGTIKLIVDYDESEGSELTADDGTALDFGNDDVVKYYDMIDYTIGGVSLADLDPKPTKNVKFILIDENGICVDTKTVTFTKDGEKGDDGAMPRTRGEYSSSETYYWNSSYRDIVLYNNKFYAVKYKSEDGITGEWDDTKWEEANQFKFIATDLLLSDAIEAKVLSAVQAQIDSLVVKRLQTLTTGGATIKIESGLMQVYGLRGLNIEFGVDDAGYAVLKYYDNNQNLLYNLGPDGIMSQIDMYYASYTELTVWSTSAVKLSDSLNKLLTSVEEQTYYKWREGRKNLNSVKQYTAWRSAPSSSTEAWQDSEFSNTDKVITTIPTDGEQPADGTIISNGYYIQNYIAPQSSETAERGFTVCLYSNGKIQYGFMVYVKQESTGGTYVFANPYKDWATVSDDTTIQDYITLTQQTIPTT